MGSHDLLSSAEWVEVAQRHLNSSKLDVLQIDLRQPGRESSGFLGEYFLAEVKVQLRDTERSQHLLRYFIKAETKTLAQQQETIAQTVSFPKEVEALGSLFADLRSVLEDEGQGMEWTCRCLYTRPDVIVLEDLMDMGYRIMSGSSETVFKECTAVITTLSNMHAASFIFEEKQSALPYRLGTERPEVLCQGFLQNTPGHPGRGWFDAAVKSALWLVEEIHGVDTLINTKSLVEEIMNSLFDLVQPSDRFRNAVCHADLWRGNIFVRLEEGETAKALLVDFQQVLYAPPAMDVMWFLHITTTRAFRAQHGPQLLDLYHKLMSRNLKRHGLQPEEILSWEEFQESCNFYKKLGIVMALCTIGHYKGENISHVFESSTEYQRFLLYDRTPELSHCFKTDDAFREKYTESINELIEEYIEKISNVS